jgi:hypothetical protein
MRHEMGREASCHVRRVGEQKRETDLGEIAENCVGRGEYGNACGGFGARTGIRNRVLRKSGVARVNGNKGPTMGASRRREGR